MKAEKWTDRELEKLEQRLTREYSKASDDLKDKYDKYINGWDETVGGKTVHHAGVYERYDKEYQAYQDGKYHDPSGKKTDEQMFNEWWLAQEGRGKSIDNLADQMTDRLADSAKTARDYTNGVLPGVYKTNYNSSMSLARESAMDQGVAGIRFDLVNEEVIGRLMTGSREVRPYKPVAIDLPKVNNYNYTKLQNELLQGILQGEDIYMIGKRFERVSNMSRSAAIRNARTAFTGAQNKGNIDAWDKLSEQGCETYKMWLATNDDRTREEHSQAESDYGSESDAIPYDEPFDVGGEELMYPGDPDGSDWNVYNCRCTMTCIHRFNSILSDEAQEMDSIDVRDSQAEEEPQEEPEAQAEEPESSEETQEEEDTFTDAKTKAEAEAYALNFADDVNYKGISLENANAINHTLTNLTSKYPTNRLDYIKQKGGKAAASANYHHLNINGRLVSYNSQKAYEDVQDQKRMSISIMRDQYKDKKMPWAIENSISKMEESLKYSRWGVGDSYPGREAEATVTHEYGHIIADQYFGQINGDRANPNLKTNYSIGYVDKRWSDVYNKAKETGDIHNLSEYGSKNSHEFFAECFCAREMGETLPDYVGSAMEKILNDGIL